MKVQLVCFCCRNHIIPSRCIDTHHISCECQLKPPQASIVVAVSKMSTGTYRRNTTLAATTSTTLVTITSYNRMVAFIVSVSILLTGWQRPVTLIDAFIIIGHYDHHHTLFYSGTYKSWTTTDNGVRQRRDTMIVPFPKQRLVSLSPTQQMAVKVYSNVATKPPEGTEVMEENENDTVLSIHSSEDSSSTTEMITSEQVKLRMDKQLERLKLKDQLSPKLSKEVCV